jgi:hypothetical protein
MGEDLTLSTCQASLLAPLRSYCRPHNERMTTIADRIAFGPTPPIRMDAVHVTFLGTRD